MRAITRLLELPAESGHVCYERLWEDQYPIGTLLLCRCGKNWHLIRPAFADRTRWEPVRWYDFGLRKLIKHFESEGDT